ncbi:MAG: FHA domain-containing protein [Deltaproteobacteria bacterium]|nr:FHA domain-containing protein [Deltaproteobacteria bacterium]
MSETTFTFQVERVQPGCTVPRGLKLAPARARVVVGRTTDADVVLDDVSVSRRHVEIRAAEAGFVVRALTRSGSTFVNHAPLAGDEEVVIDAPSAWVQVGRVLLHVMVAPATVPACAPITPPEAPLGGARAIVTLARGRELRVWIGGQLVHLFPSAARVLARLCETPGEVVTHDELLHAVDPEALERAGGANLAQLVTYVRDAFDHALERAWIADEDLRALVIGAAPEVAAEAEADRRGLLRALIASRRGLGYALRLPRSAIAWS